MQQPVRGALISMAAPALFSMLMTFLFQLVDAYFVGKLGTQPLAAISFAYPIYILIVGLFMGIASGISATVGKSLGEKNARKAKALTTISLFVFMAIALGLGVVGYFTIAPVFSFLGATEETLPLVSDYMQPLYIGMFALVGTLIGNAVLMAKGLMVRAAVVMGIAGTVNLVLDYILIFGMGPIPAMALKGAALATIISWFVSLLIVIGLLSREKMLSFTAIASLKKAATGIREILGIAMPAVAAQILNPIAIAVITRLVARTGDNAVAAFGIASRIESLALTGILALSVILTPLVAQNYGARQQSRLDQVVALSGRMTVYWGFIVYGLLLVFAGAISSIFTDNADVIRISQSYMYIVGFSYPAFGLALITTSFLNGVYQPKTSLKLTLVKSVGLTIPFAFAGSFVGVQGMWAGIALANILGAVYAGRLLNQWLARRDSSLVGHNPLMDYVSDIKSVFGKKRSG